jgi:hypothetical protein
MQKLMPILAGDTVRILCGCPSCTGNEEPEIGQVFEVEAIVFERNGALFPLECHVCGHKLTDYIVVLKGYKHYTSEEEGHPCSFLERLDVILGNSTLN